MALLNRYKIEIVHNEAAYEITPLQEDVIIQWVKESGQFFFRRRIKNDITLHGDDFHYLYEIETGANRCLPITINITRRVDEELMFTGVTYLNNANFEPDRCTVVLKIESHDRYSDLMAIWSKEVNLLDGTPKVGVNTQYKDVSGGPSDIEFFEDVQTLSIGFPGTMTFPNTNWPDFDEGWVFLYDRVEVIDGSIPGTGVTAVRTTRFGREFATTNPDGFLGGWYACTGGYCRAFPSVLKESNSELVSFGETPGEWYYEQYTRTYSWIPAEHYAFTNGVTLAECFEKFLEGTFITVSSVFFDINAAGTPPVNDPYDNGHYTDVVVFQRTDIKLPAAAQPALKMATSLKDFWAQMQAEYNCIMWLEGDTMRIEHYSWQEVLPDGIDWTVEAREYLAGTNGYNYSEQETPTGEQFYHEGEAACIDTFKRWEFTYVYETGLDVPVNCAPAFTESAQTTADKTCNDVVSIVGRPDSFNDVGFVFIACHTYGSTRMMSGGNNILQSPKRLAYLHYWNRYFPHAVYRPPSGGIEFYYFTPRKIKKQNEFSVHLDDITTFNELLPTKSGIGWGEVITAEYSFRKCELKLSLKHD